MRVIRGLLEFLLIIAMYMTVTAAIVTSVLASVSAPIRSIPPGDLTSVTNTREPDLIGTMPDSVIHADQPVCTPYSCMP